jgi:hypothetical protein
MLLDVGYFLDDYAIHRDLRNDLGLLWLVELEASGPRAIRALPLALDYCFTRRANPSETETILALLRGRCSPLGSEVTTTRDGLFEVVPAPVGG